MKRIFFFNVLWLLFGNMLNAQYYVPLNDIVSLSIEKKMCLDSNFHYSAKPYNSKDLKVFYGDTLKPFGYVGQKRKIYLEPLFTGLFNVSLQPQKTAPIYGFGGIVANYILSDKLVAHLSVYGSSFFLDDCLFNEVDSLGYIPHYAIPYQNSGALKIFSDAEGYLAYSPSRIFTFSAGRGKQFFGDGYRSLFLSDNVNPYSYLKSTVTVWKLKYVWLINGYKDKDFNILQKQHDWEDKYTAMHYLSWNLTHRINLTLFETVVWRGQDSIGRRGVDINYLNPIVFYRPVEFSLGSPDNVIMGVGGKIRLFKQTFLYGQFLLDEFKLKEMKAGAGWMGNKYALQAGIKSFDFIGINNLFFRAELNVVRPFTYSHWSSMEAYGAYLQPLAHPLGANFEELVFQMRYQWKRNTLSFLLMKSLQGVDNDSINRGYDIYRSYNDMVSEYGNTLLQGRLVNRSLINVEWGHSFVKPRLWQFVAGGRYYVANIFCNGYAELYVGIKTNLFNYKFNEYRD
jgi:hypothetical protein